LKIFSSVERNNLLQQTLKITAVKKLVKEEPDQPDPNESVINPEACKIKLFTVVIYVTVFFTVCNFLPKITCLGKGNKGS